ATASSTAPPPPPPPLPQQQQQLQGQMVVPMPGPLPSSERSEETVRLPAGVVTALRGQGKPRSGGGAVGKWPILKDIQKHTGTTAVVVSDPRGATDGGSTGTVPAGAASGSAAAGEAREEGRREGTAPATASTTADDEGGHDDASEEAPALVVTIRGPSNCVEVAAEALRKLGRGEAVRDALSFVKKTSPHRRL
ncbi:unnamed protein product, partial [Scytosiphon promiscuus]